MNLTVIIPTRNEEKSIIKTLDSVNKYVKTPHRIIVVDDSIDNTANIVKKYIKKHVEVLFIKGNPKKKSFARALKIGFDKSKHGIAVVVMADLCDDLRIIDNMYKKIIEGWDIVCGSRYIKGGKKNGGPKMQNLFSYIICKMLNIISGINTCDVSNAFKMYRLSSLRGVRFNLSSGVEASMEITLQAYFNGAKIVDIPTVWNGRTMGQSKFKIFQRTPRYIRIVCWSLENSFRQSLGFNLKKFYVD